MRAHLLEAWMRSAAARSRVPSSVARRRTRSPTWPRARLIKRRSHRSRAPVDSRILRVGWKVFAITSISGIPVSNVVLFFSRIE